MIFNERGGKQINIYHFKPEKCCGWLMIDLGLLQKPLNIFFLFVKIEEMSWLGFVCGDNWIYVINDVNYLWCKYFHLELTCFQCLFLTELCNLLICIPYLLLDSSLTELCCLLGIYAFMLTSENCFSLMHVTLSVVQLLLLLFSDLGSLFALLI